MPVRPAVLHIRYGSPHILKLGAIQAPTRSLAKQIDPVKRLSSSDLSTSRWSLPFLQ